MARYSFYTTDGPDQGKTFELEPGTTFIGRRDTPDGSEPKDSHRWILTDPAVSRTHARIDWDGSKAPVLVHLSSTNATLLNNRIVTGQSVEEGPSLVDGNKLRMGQTGFEVRQESSDTRWFLQQRGSDVSEFNLAEESVFELDGLRFNCSGPKVEVVLTESNSEAYLLRLIEGQFWTTSLKPEQSVFLESRDIVRTETRKVELLERS